MAWYHHSHREDDARWSDPPKRERVKCPVCKQDLGSKEADNVASFECKECDTTFTFYPNCNLPTAKVHRLQPKSCHCMSCKAQRGEIEDLPPPEPELDSW